MGNSIIKLGKSVIYNADDSTIDFIKQWTNEDNYIIAHTSGSTGKPKSIKLLKEDMRQSAMATCFKFGLDHNSCIISPLSANYIAGKMMIVRAIVSDSQLWIERPSNQPLHRKYPSIDLIPIVPSQIKGLLSSPYLDNVKNVIIGGSAIQSDAENQLLKAGVNAYATYGMTETCSHVALRCIGDNTYTALPGISFTTDERDCLTINAPRYSFKALTTNDIVTIIDETHFQWIGRWDNVINTGGIKVFPEEVERILSDVIFTPFYIAGTDDSKWGETVTLYVEGNDVDTDNLYKKIRQIFNNPYMIPKKIIVIDKFERTDSGKIKRLKYNA